MPPTRQRALTIGCAIAGLLGLLAIYGPLVRADPILTRDDQSLLEPLKGVRSPGDYLRARAAHRILDLQPVRDASWVLDFALGRAFGVSSFHATNLLLWMVLLLLGWRLMRLVHGGSPVLAPWLLVFAVHPIFVGSVGWIAARKHLLAGVFTIAATLLWERARRSGPTRPRTVVAIVLLYVAAVLSQPIIVLWPAWAALTLLLGGGRDRRLWSALGVCAFVMVATLAANLSYYTGDYATATPVSKLASDGGAIGLLAFGRYFANLLWPLHLATVYAPGSTLDWLGLALFGLFAIAVLLLTNRREATLWLAFYLFPLALVTVRMTNIFVSDTYLVTAVFGVLSLVLLLSAMLPPRAVPLLTVLTLLLALPLTYLSIAQAATWRSDAALWAQAYREAETPTTAAKHAFYLARSGQMEAARAVLATIPREALVGEVGQVAARVVYEDARLAAAEKERLLRQAPSSPWRNYYLAATVAGSGRFTEAWGLMREAWADHPRFGTDLPTIAAESEWFCRRAQATDCDALVPPLRDDRGWNEAAYQRRKAALGP